MATQSIRKSSVLHGTVEETPAYRFYLAALGTYVTLWEGRDQIRKTLIERGEKEHARLTQRASGWPKQVLEAFGR
ncbi:MAG: hypothetical protein HYT87_05090 [Nitrospirae bacterium]|nr:hypothetical protein [Nitrospirota bacterium]